MALKNPDVEARAGTDERSMVKSAKDQLVLVDIPSVEERAKMDWAPRVRLEDLRYAVTEPQGKDAPTALGEASSSTGVETWPHRSHVLKACAHFVFCWRCGAHAAIKEGSRLSMSKKHTMLVSPCLGEATPIHGRLGRLRKGLNPKTGKPLGPVTNAASWQ